MTLDELNSGAEDAIRPALLACCDVPRWADEVLAARPFTTVDDAAAAADRAARSFTAADVDRALAAHPRIGERPTGEGREAAWSRDEQSGVPTDDATATALLEGNRAYESRFGRVFLICATGLGAEEILAALRARLEHDDATENAVVADELRKIAVLRVRKLVSR